MRPSPRTKEFPYLASPNTQLQTVVDSVDVAASPDQVWALIGQFGGLVASIDRQDPGDRDRDRAIAYDRDDRRQADH